MMWFLLLGLGNPGRKYTGTRHNLGFMTLDRLAEREHCNWEGSRFFSESARGIIAQKKVLLLKPMTYMNLSGKAACAASQFYQVPAERICVIHDDLDLDLGRIQVKQGGGIAGHRGLRSLIDSLATDDFVRIRIGVGRPPEPMSGADYVLQRFLTDEIPMAKTAVERATEACVSWLVEGLVATMNRFNIRPSRAKEEKESES